MLVSLREPREKFWGVLLEIATAGLAISGIDLNAFDDFTRLLREGEQTSPGVVFFPIHRIDRIELDLPSGEIPSLQQRFAKACGREAESVFVTDAREQGR